MAEPEKVLRPFVYLWIEDGDDFILITLRAAEKFVVAKDRYCEIKHFTVTADSLVYNGSLIRDDDTPASLGMQPGSPYLIRVQQPATEQAAELVVARKRSSSTLYEPTQPGVKRQRGELAA